MSAQDDEPRRKGGARENGGGYGGGKSEASSRRGEGRSSSKEEGRSVPKHSGDEASDAGEKRSLKDKLAAREASPEPSDQDEQQRVSGPPALSFNPRMSPEMESFGKPSDNELEEMKKKDPRLKSAWVIWESRQKGKKDAFDSGTAVASFSTVKGFWSHWNHLPQPSELLEGKRFTRDTPEGRSIVDCLMLFKEGIKPEWEDPVNASGGHFQIQLNPKLGGAQIDEYWNNVVLGMVTGAILPHEMITGVRLVDKLNISNPVRQHIRLEVWFSDFKDKKKVEELQTSFEKCIRTKLDGSQGDGPRLEVKNHAMH